MSKVNAMQAMREARYAARKPVTAPAVTTKPVRVDAAAPAAEPRRTVSQAVVSEAVATGGGAGTTVAAELFPATEAAAGAATTLAAEAATEAPEEALCGHRSMNNRICKRPSGHAEKNHRYN